MNAKEYYEAGQLQEAIQAVSGEIEKDPTKISNRAFLAELLCVSGNLEQVDKQLDAITQQEPKLIVEISFLRHLIRAEQKRCECFLGTIQPDLIQSFSSSGTLLEVLKQLNLRNFQEADKLFTQLEPSVEVKGKINNQEFNEMRDVDDICALFCEILAANGKYYWIPYEHIVSIDFVPPKKPLDLLWRQAHIKMTNGLEGEVYIPATYAMPTQEDSYKLGRKTDWLKVGETITRGLGQRMLMFDQEAYPIMEINSISIYKEGK